MTVDPVAGPSVAALAALVFAGAAFLLGAWSVVLAVRLARVRLDPLPAAIPPALHAGRHLRWLQIALPGASVLASLCLGLRFKSEIVEGGFRGMAQLGLGAVFVLALAWVAALSIFRESALEAWTKGRTDLARVKRHAIGAWIAMCAIPCVCGLAIMASFGTGGPGAATALVIPVVAIWSQLLVPRVLARFMTLRPIEEACPGLEIEGLAATAGMSPRDVLVSEPDGDDAPDADSCNAFAMGLAGSRRIFLLDGVVRTLDRAQVRAIVAHELAHLSCRHLGKSIAASAAFSAACFLFAAWRRGSEPTALDLVLLISLAVGGPLFLRALSRRMELEADAVGAKLVPAEDMASALAAMGALDTERPPGRLRRWFATHPPIAERVARLRAVMEARKSSGEPPGIQPPSSPLKKARREA